MSKTAKLPESKLTKKQTKTFRKELPDGSVLIATVRHDDECNNRHNSFAVTGELYDRPRNPGGEPFQTNSKGQKRYLGSCGCLHDDIAKHFPELKPLIAWHLFGTDGPMHYLANARYWAGHSGWCDGKPNSPPNLEHLKSTINYGAVPDMDHGLEAIWRNDANLREWLEVRLESLMENFKAAVESVGLVY